ncbi:hypothetical protein AB1Y20_011217 [Prymnesium parvum]|uniref:Translation initiation factor eIF2B subunit epsilon n=1 Tax=Prymnesium parvum TaxID=97485 RepID=A0AB34IPG7_PRYPA
MVKTKEKDGDLTQQDVLQAVVIADSFVHHFRPITFSVPKVLMPLCNVPMIEYTLECLAAGGVQEIFIFCCVHAQLIEEYVRNSDLVRRLATVAVHVLVSQAPCYSSGDALREIEARGVIKSDFVLVPGDVVANVALGPLIAAHKKRREVDREAVITTVMKRLSPNHVSRRAGEQMVVALAGETGRLLLYEDANAHPEWQHKLRVPLALLQDTDCLQIHRDLYDTHIDICTPELLVLVQDNFDWQDLRRDLIPGVLGQFEYLGKTIYTHILSSEYAARVHDPHTYDMISRDIIQRWTFPIVPDANLLPGCNYHLGRSGVYKEGRLALARSCELQHNCIVGAGTSIGNASKVCESVIGRGCVIGERVNIHGSYLFAGVTVEDGASLVGCILCERVYVGRGAVVPKGSILGPGVRVGEGASLQPFVRLRLPVAEKVDEDDSFGDEDEDEEEEAGAEAADAPPSTLGEGGLGVVCKGGHPASSMRYDRPKLVGPVEGELSEDEDDAEEDVNQVQVDEDAAFEEEVADTVRRGVENNHSVDNLALEVNGLKFAQNRSFADCIVAIVPALLEELPLSGKSKKERLTEVKRCLNKWGALLKRFTQTRSDQVELMAVLAETAVASSDLSDIFELILNYVYERDDDLLPEEAILQWADEAAKDDSTGRELLEHPGTKKFLEWLRNAEEDDDEEDDD